MEEEPATEMEKVLMDAKGRDSLANQSTYPTDKEILKEFDERDN